MENKIATTTLSIGLTFMTAIAEAEMDDATNTLPEAKPGQCYAKVIIPARYEIKSEKVLVREESEKIESIPAKYETVEERVLIEEAKEELVPIPAKYEAVTERVEIRPKRSMWVTSLKKSGIPVSPVLLSSAKSGGVDIDAAIPGMCYQEYYTPTQFKTETKDVLISEASEKIKIIPAQYEWVEKKVLVKEASKKIVEVPATFDTITEKVLVEPARTTWKKGTGLVERIDNTTGEIMCLVEIPAKYKTVKKRIIKTPTTMKEVEIPAVYKTVKVKKLISPPQEQRIKTPEGYKTVSKKIKVADASFIWHAVHDTTKPKGEWTGNQVCLKEIPAKYKTFQKRVVKSPATIEKKTIPAVYKTIKVNKLISKAAEKRTKVPAEYKTVSKRLKVGDERLEWRQVLCETNMNKSIIAQLQKSLKNAGFNPGPADGILGRGTLRAVDNYQLDRGLPRGGLTLKTLSSLGIEHY